MPESISSWLWKPLAVILVFIVASGLTRVIMGADEPQSSRRHQAVLDGLRDRTDELVVQFDDIATLPGEWYDCTNPEDDDSGLYYSVDYDHNVIDVEADAATNIGRADSDFCEDNFGGWVGTALALAPDRKGLLALDSIHGDLARGNREQLDVLVELVAEEYVYDGESYGGSWLSTPLGDSGYSFKFCAFYPDWDAEYTYYTFVFNLNVVMGSLMVKLPTSLADDDDALAVARAFDQRIQEAIDSVSAADE